MVVFAVPDPDYLVRGQFQFVQSCSQAGSLIHAGRQDHDGFPIENDVVFEPEVANRFHDRHFVRSHRRDDRIAHVEGMHAFSPQRLGQRT